MSRSVGSQIVRKCGSEIVTPLRHDLATISLPHYLTILLSLLQRLYAVLNLTLELGHLVG